MSKNRTKAVYVSKLGPCVKRMKHRFYKADGAPAGYYSYMEPYVVKKCINCLGSFYMNKPFDGTVRNLAPSVSNIHIIQQNLNKE